MNERELDLYLIKAIIFIFFYLVLTIKHMISSSDEKSNDIKKNTINDKKLILIENIDSFLEESYN